MVMVRQGLKIISILIVSMLLFSCARNVELQLNVKASLDGKPLDGAVVKVDGTEAGRTGANGVFSAALQRKPGTEVKLGVEKYLDGHHIRPWQGSFVVKTQEGAGRPEYNFDAELKGSNFFTLAVSDKEGPVKGAAVELNGKIAGETDAEGKYTYESEKSLKNRMEIAVTRKGYGAWKKTVSIEPGETVQAALNKETLLLVKALTGEYGVTRPLPGVNVSINGNNAGKTDKNGTLVYKNRGEGKKVNVEMTAVGRIPRAWKKTVVMDGDTAIERFFYSASPSPIRTGIYGYVSNTPGEPLDAERARMAEALGNRLFSYLSFKEVPQDALVRNIKKSRLNIDAVTSKGWNKSTLGADMIILGSAMKDNNGLSFETKVYTSNGKLLFSEINSVRRESDIKSAAKKVADNIIEQFPFEGTVVAIDGDKYQINLGKTDYGMSRGMEFDLLNPKTDLTGKAVGYKNIGTLRVSSAKADSSWGAAEDLKKDRRVNIGDKVVRRIVNEETAAGAKTSFTLLAKGGAGEGALARVNVYMNDEWVGSTDSSGKIEIPARLGKKHRILLYRHGYDKLSDVVYLNKNAETKEFTLAANNATFRVESEPTGAEVFIDGVAIGKTPILDGKAVSFGFHTLKLRAGADYRDWEEVVEFNRKTVDMTGGSRVMFFKDLLKIGARAEASGDINGAIEIYRSAERKHPDYSNIKSRLGQLYMDNKQDYASAIKEFEDVLSIPENRDLVYKQFSVTYANLGHAYYEAGNELIRSDRNAAAADLAKAVQNLEKAKQNTRFYPANIYEEAVHDTYYYTALSYHKLYLLTKKPALLDKADTAWREYFDFFPKKLESDQGFATIREGARKYWAQVKDMR